MCALSGIEGIGKGQVEASKEGGAGVSGPKTSSFLFYFPLQLDGPLPQLRLLVGFLGAREADPGSGGEVAGHGEHRIVDDLDLAELVQGLLVLPVKHLQGVHRGGGRAAAARDSTTSRRQQRRHGSGRGGRLF